MKILLLTPTRHRSAAAIQAIDRVFTHSELLGVAYLAGAVRRAGFDVAVLHAEAEGLDRAGLARRLAGQRYDLVGVSTDTPAWTTTRGDLRLLRERLPDAAIVVGGPHVNAMQRVGRLAELFAEAPQIDLVAYGEGEQTLVEVARRRADGRALRGIRGTASQKQGRVIVHRPREPVADLDTLAWPALDLLPLQRYSRTPASYRREPVRSILTARGCPFDCLFCDRGAFGARVRRRSVSGVIDEVAQLVERFGTRELRFWDDVLTLDEGYLLELCSALARFGLTWSCNGRVGLLTDRMLDAMQRAGCWQVDLGIEAADDAVLRSIGKRFTAERAATTIAQVKRHGIEVRTFFILGLPGETRATARATIDFALGHDIDYATFYLPQAYPGTRLHAIAEQQGALAEDTSTYLITGSMPSYRNPNFAPGELAALQREAYRRFYRRPAYLLKRLRSLRDWDDVKRHLKALSILRM